MIGRKISALLDQIESWKRKMKEGNFQIFSKTDKCNLKYDIRSLII